MVKHIWSEQGSGPCVACGVPNGSGGGCGARAASDLLHQLLSLVHKADAEAEKLPVTEGRFTIGTVEMKATDITSGMYDHADGMHRASPCALW